MVQQKREQELEEEEVERNEKTRREKDGEGMRIRSRRKWSSRRESRR